MQLPTGLSTWGNNMYREYLDEFVEAMNNVRITGSDVPDDSSYENAIAYLVRMFSAKKTQGACLFFIGNGGSAAIASHMTADYMKNGGLKTYSLYDNAVTTCMGNDYGYEYVFSRPLDFLGNKGDLLIAISSSGNSQNILNAIQAARKNEMDVLTLTGFGEDNRVRQVGDCNIYIPNKRYGIVENAHTVILQQVVDEIMKRDGVTL